MWASSTVRPAVEWIIASAAAIQSLICSVKPMILTWLVVAEPLLEPLAGRLVAAGDADDQRFLVG